MSDAASVWTEAAEPPAETRPLEGARRADVAVIGGGYTGLSAALHLAERGAEVVTLDGAEPGWGASGRNGGQIIPGLKHDPDELERMFGPDTGRRMWQIAGAAADAVFELVARHKIACHAHACGWIAAAPHAAALDRLRARTEQWQRRGAPVELLDRAGIAALTGTTAYAGGMLDRRAGALTRCRTRAGWRGPRSGPARASTAARPRGGSSPPAAAGASSPTAARCRRAR